MILKLYDTRGDTIYLTLSQVMYWKKLSGAGVGGSIGSRIALVNGATLDVQESPEVIRSKIPQEN